MDFALLLSIVGQLGVPVVAMGLMGWWIVKFISKQREDDKERDAEIRTDNKERESKLQHLIVAASESNKLILESNHELMEANKIILETNKQLSEKIDLKLDFLIQINRNEMNQIKNLQQ